ncbi:unnamed protein product [Phytophthora lilii]|uniref:Unnamed protein product n=1 Tax=Phytophthora lilii TaxID=2077276 RepID=A0A9W6UFK8_9STRA|nr:unnamed protein product [Phytophthora lilii]
MQAIVIGLTSSITYVLVSVALASVWKYPIPFGYVLMVGPYVVIFGASAVMVIGPTVVAHSPILRKQMMSQLTIIATQGLVAVAYPLFSAIFNRLSGTLQAAFVFVMPVIKFVTKQIIAKTAASLHEYVGPIVVFSVDVFNVYYTIICMQGATSTATTLIIIASDSFHVILAIRDIFRRARVTHPSFETRSGSEPHRSSQANFLKDWPHFFSDLTASNANSGRIRIFAPYPLPLSDDSKEILQELTSSLQKKSTMVRLPQRIQATAQSSTSKDCPVVPITSQKKRVIREIFGWKRSKFFVIPSHSAILFPTKMDNVPPSIAIEEACNLSFAGSGLSPHYVHVRAEVDGNGVKHFNLYGARIHRFYSSSYTVSAISAGVCIGDAELYRTRTLVRVEFVHFAPYACTLW